MFYESISDVYDFIFPVNKKQLQFLDSLKPIEKSDKILDIGCATGNLSTLISTKSNNVTGIDLDDALLKKAVTKDSKCNVNYKLCNMLDLDKEFNNSSFDRVVSFGNTLVHLSSREDVKSYFSRVFSVLKSGGMFNVQIINYDRIINKNIDSLVTIENSEVIFKRNYKFYKSSQHIDFNTELTIKRSRKVIKNSIPLLALVKEEIELYLRETGFQSITFYGDLMGGELVEGSVPLLFSCIK